MKVIRVYIKLYIVDKEIWVKYLHIWDVSHCSVSDEHDHERAVPQHAHHEDDGKHDGHDVGLRPLGVGNIVQHHGVIVIQVVVCVAPEAFLELRTGGRGNQLRRGDVLDRVIHRCETLDTVLIHYLLSLIIVFCSDTFYFNLTLIYYPKHNLLVYFVREVMFSFCQMQQHTTLSNYLLGVANLS